MVCLLPSRNTQNDALNSSTSTPVTTFWLPVGESWDFAHSRLDSVGWGAKITSDHHALRLGRVDVILQTHTLHWTDSPAWFSPSSGEAGRQTTSTKAEAPRQFLTCRTPSCPLRSFLRGMGWANKQGHWVPFRLFMVYSATQLLRELPGLFMPSLLPALQLLRSASWWLPHFCQQAAGKKRRQEANTASWEILGTLVGMNVGAMGWCEVRGWVSVFQISIIILAQTG